MMFRKRDLIVSVVPDNQVWVLSADNLEIAIRTPDHFLGMR